VVALGANGMGMTPDSRGEVGAGAAPPPFIGRHRELELLERCLADAIAGTPRFVLLGGEAGIGKSRLLKELRNVADRKGVQVFYGRCAEDLPLPYLAFVEALEVPLQELLGPDAESVRGLLRRGAGAETGDLPFSSSGAEQLRLFRAVARACVGIAQRRPTMLILEDLHWADRSTIDLLQHLVFTVADTAMRDPAALLIAATYRSAEADPRLERGVARLRREDIAVIVDVPGLEEVEVDALICRLGHGKPSHQLVRTIAATARGNPLFIQELVHDLVKRRALRRRGGYLAAIDDPSAMRLPDEIASMIAARIEPLGARSRAALGWAALLGSRFSLEMLAAVAEMPEDELLGWLEEAIRQRLLVSQGAAFEFAHPLVRRVLASEPSGARVERMHLRIAETLQRLHGGRPDDHLLEITHHLIAAGSAAEPRDVLRHARLAGERALVMSAWGDAARYFEAALAAAQSCGDCPAHDRAALHHRAAFAYSRDLDAGPCLEQYELAIAAYREIDDPCGVARAVAERTRAHVMLASAPYGALVDVEPLRQALAALGGREPLLYAQGLAILALAYWTARRPDEAERAAREALATGIGDDSLLAEAYHALALSQLHAMRLDDALGSWQQSRAHAQRAGDRWLEGVALQRIPTALIGLGRLADAEATALEAAALGRETHNWSGCSVALGNLVLVSVAVGNYALAEERAREALIMTRRARYGWAAAYFLPALAGARALRGAWSEAADALAILVEPGEVFDDPGPALQLLAWVCQQLVRAHGEIAADDVTDRLRRLASAGAPAEIVNLAGFSALVEVGDLLDDAQTAAAPYAALRVAAERGVQLTIGWCFLLDRVLAVSATHARRWMDAEQHFTTAAAAAERMGAAPELARTRLDHARMLIARGDAADRDRAAALVRDAHAEFQRLGLAPLAARAMREAERLRISCAPTQPVGDTSELSARDLDVLRRVARGRSVAEIADELAVAPASAEERIRVLLQKIGAQPDSVALAKPTASFPAAPGKSLHPLVIMFTDMEGSTAAIERLGDARAHALQRTHDAIVRAAVVVNGGAEVNHTGDGFLATFRSASGAIACAVAIQQAMARHSRSNPALAVRVRIGLNAGEPIADRELLFGAAVNLAARICARARGGQILVADVVRHLASGRGVRFTDRGRVVLKGFQGRFRVFEVPWQMEE
jgi:class 3 adenylate cyclase